MTKVKSDEFRNKISKISSEKLNTPSINKRLRKALKDKVHGNTDTVTKMRAGGMKHAKAVKAINIDTGEEHIFLAQRIAARELDVDLKGLRNVLSG